MRGCFAQVGKGSHQCESKSPCVNDSDRHAEVALQEGNREAIVELFEDGFGPGLQSSLYNEDGGDERKRESLVEHMNQSFYSAPYNGALVCVRYLKGKHSFWNAVGSSGDKPTGEVKSWMAHIEIAAARFGEEVPKTCSVRDCRGAVISESDTLRTYPGVGGHMIMSGLDESLWVVIFPLCASHNAQDDEFPWEIKRTAVGAMRLLPPHLRGKIHKPRFQPAQLKSDHEEQVAAAEARRVKAQSLSF